MEKITLGHPLSQSEDLVKQSLETLKSLFPTIVKEGKIDVDELRSLLGEEVETGEESYRFTWAGKSMARREANKPSTATLRPNKSESKEWDNTGNIFIEGDNLEVLKLLQKSYADKIKMIYIDPTYNTGKDFVYKDNYDDNLANYLSVTGQTDEEGKRMNTNTESDGRFHSNWLNMIYPRLRLARNLLREDGVVFISIDDNEVHNLRKVCDEVFGENNFLGIFVNNSTPNARDYGHIGKMHEYCIFYAKNIAYTETFLLEDKEKTFRFEDDLSGFNVHPLYNSNVAFTNKNRPNLYYPFYIDPGKNVKELGEEFFELALTSSKDALEIYPPKSLKDNVQFVWRWGKDKSASELNKEIIGYRNEEGEYRVVQKMRTSEKVIRSILSEKDFTSRRGTAEVEAIFGKKIFSFPKPAGLIKTFIKVGCDKDGIVLDFFAGSCTTAHATMQLNAEDEGRRKFICVQLPELLDDQGEAAKMGYKTVADIGKDRIRKAGEKIKAETNATSHLNQIDIGFKAFKLDSSNIWAWDGHPDNLDQNLFSAANNIKENRTEDDVLYEIFLKYGLDLTVAIEQQLIAGKQVFNMGGGALFVCLADNLTTDVAEGIGKWKEELQPATCRVIFKDTGFTDVEKTNSVQILKRYGITETNTI